ncbi:MAG: glycoside hydrolase family 95 protein [Paludibacteraceae bacterium]
MKLSRIFFSFILSFFTFITLNAEDKNLIIRYDSPASIWESTLPLGNGRLGMMPDGGTDTENIVLNDITMWSGSVENAMNIQAIDYLPQIRKYLLEGKNLEAQNLMYSHFKCNGPGSGFGQGKDIPFGCFQMLGNLKITYNYPSAIQKTAVSDYNFALNLNNAIASTVFRKGKTAYTREYFVSHNADVMVIRISSDKKNAVGFSLDLSRPERGNVALKDNVLSMQGQLNDGQNTTRGVQYKTSIRVVSPDGKISSNNGKLLLEDASEALIIVSSSTSLLDKNYLRTVESLLENASSTSYFKLRTEHINKYQEKFNRVSLKLGDDKNAELPASKRLYEFQKNDDPAFAALYFQFGRYLMISGTRENSMPLNLQGLWAKDVQTPWNGDYHLNINVQMNYWPAEVCNLSELHKPLIDFTKSLVPSGEVTANTFYNAEGWVAHVITNPWRFTAPGEHASWGATNTGGAWLCEHLWEHYAFTRDKNYLKSIFPTLTGAARFFLSMMIAEPKNGWLVTAPSSSPENAFYLPENGKEPVYVCMGPTMDVQIITELFNNVLSAAEILSVEDPVIDKIKAALPKLPPMQVSKEGYLQEWLEDYKEEDPRHRHVSHLYGLYPSNQISTYRTPELANAARETLNRRGDEGTGWSRAWKVNFWARLHDGNRSYKLLKSLLQPAFATETSKKPAGGTYPNLFCSHPPFQIDGNFGGTAGIAEMLIQSQDGFVEFLPALPDKWSKGEFKGLRVRGGAEMDVKWENNKITEAVIRAIASNTIRIKLPEYVSDVTSDSKNMEKESEFLNLRIYTGDRIVLNFRNK